MMSPTPAVARSGRSLRAYVGSYESGPGANDGGIRAFDVLDDGRLKFINHVPSPGRADFLAYADTTRTLYAVDQRTNDGRGPLGPPSAVWSLKVDPDDGSVRPLNRQLAPGSSGNYLCLSADQSVLFSAQHGGFTHVEHVRQAPGGQWTSEYLYDDSVVIAFQLLPDGSLGPIRDVHLRTGHGKDPNTSPQAGGHAQASPHAHCAEVDPSGRWLIVCDKGTDHILVLSTAAGLPIASSLQMPPETGPRHIAFDATSDRAYVTCELSSELAALTFNAEDGTLELIEKTSSVLPGQARLNEPASVRVDPTGRFVYMNNRGEDVLCWWSTAAGSLERRGAVALAPSEHPGVAARSFALDSTGHLLFAADLPANVIRSYAVDPGTGTLTPGIATPVHQPAYVQLIEGTKLP